MRLASVTPMIKEERVYQPQSAIYLEDLIYELCGFPGLRHDDRWTPPASSSPGFGTKEIRAEFNGVMRNWPSARVPWLRTAPVHMRRAEKKAFRSILTAPSGSQRSMRAEPVALVYAPWMMARKPSMAAPGRSSWAQFRALHASWNLCRGSSALVGNAPDQLRARRRCIPPHKLCSKPTRIARPCSNRVQSPSRSAASFVI